MNFYVIFLFEILGETSARTETEQQTVDPISIQTQSDSNSGVLSFYCLLSAFRL